MTIDTVPTTTNVEIVQAFYQAALNEKDFAKASQYIGTTYKQHNPAAQDGPQGFAAFLDFLRATFPDSAGEVRRVWSDGDFVILHVLERRHPEDRGDAVVDIFRLEAGKVVEHWDVTQAIPEDSANPNPMI